MFAFKPGAQRAAVKPSAKRTPPAVRGGRRKDALTTITADPIITDPALAAPLMTWDVTAPDGTYAGAFQGSTPEDAILSYVATMGYASIDDAALAQGFADAVTYASAFVVTETLAPAGMDPSLAPVDPLAAPAALSRRGRRPCFVKMGETIPMVDSMPSVDPTIVSGVTVAEATLRRYRAVVSRTANATAVVEFDAYEDEDLYKLAEALVPQIPAEAWSVAVDPNSSCYIDRIEPLAPAADPALTTLSRRGRKSQQSLQDIVNIAIPEYGVVDYTVEGLSQLISYIDAHYAVLNSTDPLADGYGHGEGYLNMLRVAAQTELDALLASAPSEILGEGYDKPEDEMPPEMLSRRSRKSIARRLRLKATFTVADAETGEVIGTYDATTSDDAILSYVTALGYETVEAAAAGEGFATVEEMLATITVTEGEAAGPAEPETPAETLARRHRLRMKATFEAVDPATGEVLGTFDAGTIDDAILSYAAQLGYGSADEAAAAAGLSLEEWLATFTISEVAAGTEAPPAESEMEIEIGDDDDDDEMEPPAAMSRTGRKGIVDAAFYGLTAVLAYEWLQPYVSSYINAAMEWLTGSAENDEDAIYQAIHNLQQAERQAEQAVISVTNGSAAEAEAYQALEAIQSAIRALQSKLNTI